MRIHDLPGHTPSEEWLNKTDLEIHTAQPKEGYYLKHGNKGIIFWAADADMILHYLVDNYVPEGFKTMVCCDFITPNGARWQGSKKKPIELKWKIVTHDITT